MDSLDEYINNLENIVKQKGVNFINENEAKFNTEEEKELNEYFIKKFKFNKGAFTKRREKIDEIIFEKKKELKSIKKEFIYYYEKENEIVLIKKLSVFLTEINKIITSKNNFYRGQGNMNWDFQASLFREDSWKNNEKNMFYDTIIRKPKEFEECKNDFERLVKMQHYGLPTRLIDLTPNPLIALYFSCLEEDTHGQVFLIETDEKDIKHFESNEIINVSVENGTFLNNGTDHLIVRARHNNERIIKQDGLFIFTDTSSNNFNFFKRNNKTLRFIIHKKSKKEILKELEKIGIHEGTIFPEIDRVTKYLKETKYK